MDSFETEATLFSDNGFRAEIRMLLDGDFQSYLRDVRVVLLGAFLFERANRVCFQGQMCVDRADFLAMLTCGFNHRDLTNALALWVEFKCIGVDFSQSNSASGEITLIR